MNRCPQPTQLQLLIDEQLSADEYRAIESHVQQCPLCQTALDRLTAPAGQVLRKEAETNHEARTIDRPGPPAVAEPPTLGTGPRYQKVRFHARGGLGEVHVAHDSELDRDVALKHIRDEHAGDAEGRRRFLQEAKITGKLEHPGIVPVYGLVQGEDGHPCYAMRFIQGESLKDAIDRYHQPTAVGTPGQKSLALRQLLTAFVTVCKTMAYAHSRGIVHRDLKPQNIMLGKYGETLVVDWGLAKPVTRTEADRAGGEESVRPTGRESSEETPAGAVMGTPAYMSPEQLMGRALAVGPASDIYSLGATLYCLLTDRPPFAEGLADRILNQGAFQAPRQLNPRVPRALEAICLHAMQARAKDRYATAMELAEDVEHWLADEPLQAYREPWGARLLRWARRHKPQVAAAVVLVMTVLVLGGAGLWWLAQRRQAADAAVVQTLGEARVLLAQAREAPLAEFSKFAQALDTARKAQKLADTSGASADLSQQAAALAADLAREAHAAAKDYKLVTALLEVRGPHEGPRYRADAKGLMVALAQASADQKFAAAFRDWGLDIDATPAAEAAARLKSRPAAVITEMSAALDAWALERRQAKNRPRWQHLGELVTRLDDQPDSSQRRLRAILLRGNLPIERALGEVSQALLPFQALTCLVAGRDRTLLRGLAKKTDAATESLSWLLNLTRALVLAGDHVVAERLLKGALRARPREVLLHYALADLLRNQWPPRWGEAIECYVAARALRPELGVNLADALVQAGRVEDGLSLWKHLVGKEPDNPWLHFGYGYALYAQHDLPGAIQAYRKAIHLNPKDAEAYNNLGNALADQQDLPEAIQAYGKVIEMNPKLVEPYNNLGTVLAARHDLSGAIQAFRKAIDVNPKYAMAYFNLGNALADQHDLPGAIQAYHKAIDLNPKDAKAYNNLGNALADQHDLPGAIQAFGKAIALNPKLAEAYNNLGNALADQHDLPGAIQAFGKAIALNPKLVKAYYNLGAALHDQKDLPGAIQAYSKAIDLNPKFAEAYYNLGLVLYAQHDLRGAVEAFYKAIELNRKLADAHINLGLVFYQNGEFAQALASLKQGAHWLPASDQGRASLLQMIQSCQRLADLEGKLPAVLHGNEQPATAAERIEYAHVSKAKRLVAAAARFYEQAFAADAKLADALKAGIRYNAACAAALAAAGQGIDAAKLEEKERVRLRGMARQWLRADLAAWSRKANQGPAQARKVVAQTLQDWQTDPDLASVREPAALVKLPEHERKDWQHLWADVAALLKRAQGK